MRRCISIRQPFAELILNGKKKIELRNWRIKKKGIIFIHASKANFDLTHDWMDRFEIPDINFNELPRGCIVGSIDIVSVETTKTQHIDSALYDIEDFKYAWHLSNPKRAVDNKPVRGMPGIFYAE